MFNLRNIVMGERTGGYQVSECQTWSLQNFRLRSVRLTGREMENKIWVERRRQRRDSRQDTQLIITERDTGRHNMQQSQPQLIQLMKIFHNIACNLLLCYGGNEWIFRYTLGTFSVI